MQEIDFDTCPWVVASDGKVVDLLTTDGPATREQLLAALWRELRARGH
jgi:hypothetical protein